MKSIVAAVSMFLLTPAGMGLAQQMALSGPTSAPPLKISFGDMIDVTMYDDPGLSGHYRVDEKGDLTVPLLGRMHVRGMTATEVSTAIEKEYVSAGILTPGNAYANVFISQFATQGITVSGEVRSPGIYPSLGIRMLNDVITAAGGVSTGASSRVVITRRDDPDHPVTVDYNPALLDPKVPQVQIYPGDSVTVPRAGIIYVIGNVGRPGGYILEGRRALTIEEVMALAGGGGHGAAMNRAQLVRTLPTGAKEAITIQVNRIYENKAPDVVLKDGDILFVPTSHGKLVTEQALLSGVGIGTSIATYRIALQ